MAGAEPKGHAAGTKPGDLLHEFRGGSIRMITEVNIDLAGDVWAANHWNDMDAVLADKPGWAASTKGGLGFTVTYGVASPVQPPRMGKVRGY